MEKIIENLDKDICRCKESLNSNNLLEISISIEEMIGKYKNNKKDLISLEKYNVWLYNKLDLENIISILENLKIDYINKYKSECIKEGFENIKVNLQINENITQIKKNEALFIVDELENIINNNTNYIDIWERVKVHIEYISKQDCFIGYELLNLLNLMLKFSKS